MRKLLFGLLLALLVPRILPATPTRILTIDNGNMIVPDDWDATYYYSRSPAFNNHWYIDTYANGKSLSWAFLDINIGTLVVWFNKEYEGGALYSALATNGAGLGFSATDFSTDVSTAWEPRENRLKAPDNKLALGLAVPVMDSLTLGLCFRLAQLTNIKNFDNQDGTGGPVSLSISSATYEGTLYPALYVNKYGNTQSSDGLVISPQISFDTDRFSFDAKYDMVWSGIDNKHTEEVSDGLGTRSGTITQTLKDKERLSWYLKPKLRFMLNDRSSLMLRGTLGHLDLSADHRVAGTFSGSAFSAAQLAGYDHIDATADMGIDQWDLFGGWLNTWDGGKNLVVIGVGGNGQTAKVLATQYQQKAGGSSYNDLTAQSVTDVTDTKWAVPLVMGTELTLNKWLKGRGMVSRNLFTLANTKTVVETFNSAGVKQSRKAGEVGSDYGPGWVLGTGFGMNFGQLSWDIALNTGFLAANNTVFTNPLYQSSFTYEF
jgi:hypothetical protein